MKKVIKNDHPVPMEVIASRVVLQPGESIEIDVPDDPAPAAAAPAKVKPTRSADRGEGDK